MEEANEGAKPVMLACLIILCVMSALLSFLNIVLIGQIHGFHNDYMANTSTLFKAFSDVLAGPPPMPKGAPSGYHTTDKSLN